MENLRQEVNGTVGQDQRNKLRILYNYRHATSLIETLPSCPKVSWRFIVSPQKQNEKPLQAAGWTHVRTPQGFSLSPCGSTEIVPTQLMPTVQSLPCTADPKLSPQSRRQNSLAAEHTTSGTQKGLNCILLAR